MPIKGKTTLQLLRRVLDTSQYTSATQTGVWAVLGLQGHPSCRLPCQQQGRDGSAGDLQPGSYHTYEPPLDVVVAGEVVPWLQALDTLCTGAWPLLPHAQSFCSQQASASSCYHPQAASVLLTLLETACQAVSSLRLRVSGEQPPATSALQAAASRPETVQTAHDMLTHRSCLPNKQSTGGQGSLQGLMAAETRTTHK